MPHYVIAEEDRPVAFGILGPFVAGAAASMESSPFQGFQPAFFAQLIPNVRLQPGLRRLSTGGCCRASETAWDGAGRDCAGSPPHDIKPGPRWARSDGRKRG